CRVGAVHAHDRTVVLLDRWNHIEEQHYGFRWMGRRNTNQDGRMMSRDARGPRRGDRGAAMVELAFGLTFLAVILVGTVDFARIFYFSMELTSAARAGAQ